MKANTSGPHLALVVLLALLALLALGSVASAHAGDESYLYFEVSAQDLAGRVEMPISDLNEALDLGLEATSGEILAAIQARRDVVVDYLHRNFAVGADGTQWDVTFTDIELLDANEPADGNYVLFFFEVDAPATVPRTLEVTFSPFFDELNARGALLLIANDWRAGIIDNGEEALQRFSPDDRTQKVDLGTSSQLRNFKASVSAGIDHIRTGPDHILFVLVLLLPSVLIFRTSWEPAATFASTIWRILKIVSMFTLAHSVTFVMAGLDVIALPPSKLVEVLIAASIAATALHNLRPIWPNRESLIAFVFGLFHGLGFAALVTELDVSTKTQLVSLLGRNVGIEVGQSVVVLLVFPSLFLLRRTAVYKPVFMLGSAALALISTGWIIERLFVLDLRFSRAVEIVVEWPRSLLLLGSAAAAAAVVRERAARRGQLLDCALQPSGLVIPPAADCDGIKSGDDSL